MISLVLALLSIEEESIGEMAGRELRSRRIPSVPETETTIPKSNLGRARVHLFLQSSSSRTNGATLAEIGELKAEGSQRWKLRRCVLPLEKQEMKGRQRHMVTLSSGSSSTDTGTNDESEDEDIQILSDHDNQSTANIDLQKSRCKKPAKKATDDKGPRLIVDNDHVATLVRDYRKHFVDFSRGRKKKTKQLIPNKVWTNVYKDYRRQFPKSAFKPESLKIHLREALTDLHSGVNNPETENHEGAELQDADEMRALYNTDGFLRRNVLQVRQKSMEGSASKKPKIDSQPATPVSQSTGSPSTPQTEKGNAQWKPFTKKETLKKAGDDIASVLTEVKSIREKQCVESKHVVDEIKTSLIEARREEATARKVFQDKQNILADIRLLEKQRDLGLISEDQFKEKCRATFGC